MKTIPEKTLMAISRLENPHGLDDERILMYQNYLTDCAEETVYHFIDNSKTDVFPLLLKYRVIKKSNVIKFTDYAREKKKNDILFYLMEAGNILRTGGKNGRIAKKHIRGKTPLPPPMAKVDFSDAKPGNIIWLGNEPMPWLVLENKEKRVLLLSWFVFECLPYKNFYLGYTTWSRSTLRLKLHTEHLDRLFTREEKQMIVPVYIDDETDELSFEPFGKCQADSLFALSEKEVRKYMRTERERYAPLTKQATISPMWTVFDQYAFWWLRSPGAHQMEKMYVRNGVITSENSIVNGDDCFDYYGLRPAVYMKY